jgi:hypothetical protein
MVDLEPVCMRLGASYTFDGFIKETAVLMDAVRLHTARSKARRRSKARLRAVKSPAYKHRAKLRVLSRHKHYAARCALASLRCAMNRASKEGGAPW